MVRRLPGVALLALLIASAAHADDKPLERLDLDQRIVKSVYETALLGTDLFNKGKHEECFRLYQGALIAIQPLLDHRPKLMALVKDRMDKANVMKPAEGAFVLREALDEIQNEIAPSDKREPKKELSPKSPKQTLWDRLGGEKAVRLIVKDFLKAAQEDKAVNFFRNGKYKLDAKAEAHMEQLFVELVSLFAQGPLDYSDKRTLKEIHTGMNITGAEFDAMLADLRKTLEKHKVGPAETADLLKHFAATRSVVVEPKPKEK